MRNTLVAALIVAAIAAPAAAGSAVLTWAEVTQNVDDSPITDLAGYRIRWGCGQPGTYPDERTILHPGLHSFHVTGLPDTGTCYFTVHAINSGRVDIGDGLMVSATESDPANPAEKVMNSAPPAQPYTRAVDWVPGPGVAALELRQASRLWVGYVGDPLVVRLNATSSATRAELRATFVQSGEQVVQPWTGSQTTWTPPFAGLWELEVRSCNGAAETTCGEWRNAREDNSVFLFKLKAPTGGGIDP